MGIHIAYFSTTPGRRDPRWRRHHPARQRSTSPVARLLFFKPACRVSTVVSHRASSRRRRAGCGGDASPVHRRHVRVGRLGRRRRRCFGRRGRGASPSRSRARGRAPLEIWRPDARARARARGGRRRARGAVRRRVRAQRAPPARAGREHRPRGPRARQAPRRAGRARRVLHPRALPSPVRLAPTVGSRPPPEQDVVQGRPPARVHRVHLLPLLPPEDQRRQDPMRVRRVAPPTPRRTRPRRVVRPLPRDAHGREHRRGARRPRVAMPRLPRHLQLQRRELPPRQARPLPDPAAHSRGALARMAIRRALPHRHQGRGV